MSIKKLLPAVKADFAIVDSIFPQKEPFAFRNTEINEYFRRLPTSSSFTMPPMLPGKEAWFNHGYGMTKEQFEVNKAGYLQHYPENKPRLHYIDLNRRYLVKLAYSFFLAETYTLLPFYEKNNIPFVFVLYPGGCFGLNHAGSDRMLRRIFASPQFKAVISTQSITHDYLVNEIKLSPNKIRHIYGGFVQFKQPELHSKKYFMEDKDTFDVCFVAAKYTENGVDKGYDGFIETAKILAKECPRIQFHVIGGFDESDIDVAELKDKIIFYGYKKPDFLKELYAKMDIFFAPNKASMIFEGNFDGFPLGIDAGYCGVALLVADPLKMNQYYVENEEIVIVSAESKTSAEKIAYYYSHPKELYKLAHKGMLKTQELFDIDRQINARLEVFTEFVNLDIRRAH